MTKARSGRRTASPGFRDMPGRRTVVLLSDLPLDGRAWPIPAGRVVEASAERFADLTAAQVRDATDRDRAMAGHQLVQLDLDPTEPSPSATTA